MTIDAEMLMAYADDALEPDDREKVERALAGDHRLREQLQAQIRLKTELKAHYGPVASEPVPDRLLAMLGAETSPDDGIPSLANARSKRSRQRQGFDARLAWVNWGAVAASLAVGVLGGHMLRDRGPVGARDGMLVVQGPLARDLETRLASAPAAGTRIGLTFADREGRACRTFDSADLSGLACRSDGHWALLAATAPAGQSSQYRQAGSAAVIETAEEIMAGAPLDAAQEKAAMEAGWKIPRPGPD
jgi:hypothetical protein